MSDANSQRYLEIAAIADSKKQEAEILSQSLLDSNAMNVKLEEESADLRRRCSILEDDSASLAVEYQKKLTFQENENESEKKNLILHRIEHEDGVRVTLLRRALLAEDEVSKLQNTCTELEAKKADLAKNSGIKSAFLAVQRNMFDGTNDMHDKVTQLQGDIDKLRDQLEEKNDLIKEKNGLLGDKDNKIRDLNSKLNPNPSTTTFYNNISDHKRPSKGDHESDDRHIRLIEITDLLPAQSSSLSSSSSSSSSSAAAGQSRVCDTCQSLQERLREVSKLPFYFYVYFHPDIFAIILISLIHTRC